MNFDKEQGKFWLTKEEKQFGGINDEAQEFNISEAPAILEKAEKRLQAAYDFDPSSLPLGSERSGRVAHSERAKSALYPVVQGLGELLGAQISDDVAEYLKRQDPTR